MKCFLALLALIACAGTANATYCKCLPKREHHDRVLAEGSLDNELNRDLTSQNPPPQNCFKPVCPYDKNYQNAPWCDKVYVCEGQKKYCYDICDFCQAKGGLCVKHCEKNHDWRDGGKGHRLLTGNNNNDWGDKHKWESDCPEVCKKYPPKQQQNHNNKLLTDNKDDHDDDHHNREPKCEASTHEWYDEQQKQYKLCHDDKVCCFCKDCEKDDGHDNGNGHNDHGDHHD